MTARKELDKFQALYHQNMSSIKASKEVNNILSKQRSPLLRTGLGYEEASSRKQKEHEHIMQTKGNEDETNTKIKNSDQNDQPFFSHEQSQQKGRQPRFRYQFFSMVTVIVVLILATKLQIVHLILEICNQIKANCCNIEQDSQQVNKNYIQLNSQLKE